MGMLSDREFWELVAKYGKDFLQSTSNNIASQVSVPVDASAWLLRKAGAPIPAAPMLSSEWMKNAGITRPVDHSPASMAGEVVGSVSPVISVDKLMAMKKLQQGMAERKITPDMLRELDILKDSTKRELFP